MSTAEERRDDGDVGHDCGSPGWATDSVRSDADDQHGAIVLHETATRTDGAELAMDEVHVLTIDPSGRITNLWDLPADAEAHDRFFDGK